MANELLSFLGWETHSKIPLGSLGDPVGGMGGGLRAGIEVWVGEGLECRRAAPSSVLVECGGGGVAGSRDGPGAVSSGYSTALGIAGVEGEGMWPPHVTPSPPLPPPLLLTDGPDVPRVTITSQSDPSPESYVLVNSTVTLTCSSASEPEAGYVWSIGESGNTEVPHNAVLTLRHVRLDQAGTYSCIATNPRLSRSVRQSLCLNVYGERPEYRGSGRGLTVGVRGEGQRAV
ncbi:hypothetical protein chiPu_0029591, partial [Chiloscyllium punctatum]|nr:hypothetical protein [Chiloscyllium punctatum]